MNSRKKKKILIATDGSEYSKAAVEEACEYINPQRGRPPRACPVLVVRKNGGRIGRRGDRRDGVIKVGIKP